MPFLACSIKIRTWFCPLCRFAAASTTAAGPPDSSVVAAGGPFLMEGVETIWPLELILSDLQAMSCLLWGPLRLCFPWCYAALRGLRGAPEQQQHLKDCSRSSSSKLALAKRVLQVLLQLLKLIATAGALALGAALGALLTAVDGRISLWPLRLRQVCWCVSLDKGGYLILYLLSPQRQTPGDVGGEGRLGEAPAFTNLCNLLWMGLRSLFRLGRGTNEELEGTLSEFGGFEALVITPLPQSPEISQAMGLQQLEQLQNQHRCNLASLRFGGTSPAPAAESPSQGDTFSPQMSFSATGGAFYSSSDVSQALSSSWRARAPEGLPGGPSPSPAHEDGGPCIVTWIGGLRWGLAGVLPGLGAALSLRRAETVLGTLLSQAAARRALHASSAAAAPGSPKGLSGALPHHLQQVGSRHWLCTTSL